jgi:hypothetical protein
VLRAHRSHADTSTPNVPDLQGKPLCRTLRWSVLICAPNSLSWVCAGLWEAAIRVCLFYAAKCMYVAARRSGGLPVPRRDLVRERRAGRVGEEGFDALSVLLQRPVENERAAPPATDDE